MESYQERLLMIFQKTGFAPFVVLQNQTFLLKIKKSDYTWDRTGTVHFYGKNMNKIISIALVLIVGLFVSCSTILATNSEDMVTTEKTLPVADPIVGSWEGNLVVQPGAELKLVFTIVATPQGYHSSLSIPQQGVKSLPIEETMLDENGKLTLSMVALGAVFSGVYSEVDSQAQIEGTFTQSGFAFPLTLKPLLSAISSGRIQDPVKPYPYISEDVVFIQSPDGFKLAGTITRPNQPGQFPAVVLVSGSGSQDRNEEIMNHRPFLVLADALTRAGIVVLRYDDRGFAESGGDATLATTLDLAHDSASALSFLASKDYTDKNKMGIIGHSEGGIIAPIIASQRDDVAYIVMMAGMGVTGIEILKDQTGAILRSQGAPQAYIDQVVATNTAIYETIIEQSLSDDAKKTKVLELLAAVGLKPEEAEQQIGALFSPWYQQFLVLDPVDYLKKVTVPVLILNGTKDTQVTSSLNVPAIENALTQGGNTQFKSIVYEGLNHLFQPAETGAIAEYASIEITIDPRVLSDIASWILER